MWLPRSLIFLLLMLQPATALAEEASSEKASEKTGTESDRTKSSEGKKSQRKQSKGKRVREREQEEGTQAPDRFEANTVIKSRYHYNGEPLEVDPD